MSAVTTPKVQKPLKLNRKTEALLVKAIQTGATYTTAAKLVGVGRTSLWRWLDAGRADQEAGRRTACARLALAVEQAEAQFEVKALAQIQMAAAAGDARSAQWLLERRYAHRWAQSNRVVLDGQVEHQHEHRHVISEELTGGRQPVELDSRARRAAAELLQKAADEAREPDVVDAEVVDEQRQLPAAVPTVPPSGDLGTSGDFGTPERDAQRSERLAHMRDEAA